MGGKYKAHTTEAVICTAISSYGSVASRLMNRDKDLVASLSRAAGMG